MSTPTQEQKDRAMEWCAEHYPAPRTDAEHEARYEAALAHIVALDAAADAAEEARMRRIRKLGGRS